MQIDTKSDAILLGFKEKEHLIEFAKKEPEKYAKLFPIILQARKRFKEIEQEVEQDFLKVFDGFDIKGFMKEFDTTISSSSQKRVFKQEGVNGSTEKIITNLESTIVFIQEQERQIKNLEKGC